MGLLLLQRLQQGVCILPPVIVLLEKEEVDEKIVQ